MPLTAERQELEVSQAEETSFIQQHDVVKRNGVREKISPSHSLIKRIAAAVSMTLLMQIVDHPESIAQAQNSSSLTDEQIARGYCDGRANETESQNWRTANLNAVRSLFIDCFSQRFNQSTIEGVLQAITSVFESPAYVSRLQEIFTHAGSSEERSIEVRTITLYSGSLLYKNFRGNILLEIPLTDNARRTAQPPIVRRLDEYSRTSINLTPEELNDRLCVTYYSNPDDINHDWRVTAMNFFRRSFTNDGPNALNRRYSAESINALLRDIERIVNGQEYAERLQEIFRFYAQRPTLEDALRTVYRISLCGGFLRFSEQFYRVLLIIPLTDAARTSLANSRARAEEEASRLPRRRDSHLRRVIRSMSPQEISDFIILGSAAGWALYCFMTNPSPGSSSSPPTLNTTNCSELRHTCMSICEGASTSWGFDDARSYCRSECNHAEFQCNLNHGCEARYRVCRAGSYTLSNQGYNNPRADTQSECIAAKNRCSDH